MKMIMGSRIMHLVITNRIADRLSMIDKTTFLFGGIAPDAVSPKELSHFFKGDVQTFSRSVDFKRFLDKYSPLKKNHYIWGYFTHLIADDLWLKGFYLPWLKNRIEANKETAELYHGDFRLLNGKLLEFYGFYDELTKALDHVPDIIDLQEVTTKDFEKFIPSVLEDMEYDKHIVNETLNIFTFDQIIGYIETSVDMGLYYMKSNQMLSYISRRE